MEERQHEAGDTLNALIAEKVFGYPVSAWSLHVINSSDDVKGKRWQHGIGSSRAFALGEFPTEVLMADGEGDMPIVEMQVGNHWQPIPEYSTDIAAAYEMEGKIKERGLEDNYMLYLWRVTGGDKDLAYINRWEYVHATPEQRCLAALKVVGASA